MPDYRYNVVLQEEAARALVTLSTVRTQLEVILPYFLHYANDEQRERWFPGLAAGTLLTAIAMTEPGTGSDLAGMRTTAVRDGDDYIVNGAKTFITGGMQADLVIVVARTSTDPDNRRKGPDAAGRRGRHARLHPRPRAGEDGLQGAGHRRAVLRRRPRAGRQRARRGGRGVRLPRPQPAPGAADRRGRVGRAGAGRRSHAAIDYTKDRKAFGTPVASFQNTKFELAACSTEVEAAQAMLDRAVRAARRRRAVRRPTRPGSSCSAPRCRQRVVDRCLQLFGGYGYMMEYPIARLYTDARVARIYAGTSEVMKVIIAKSARPLSAISAGQNR